MGRKKQERREQREAERLIVGLALLSEDPDEVGAGEDCLTLECLDPLMDEASDRLEAMYRFDD